MKFLDIFGKKPVIFDGSMGTFLHDMGLKTGEIPEEWNFTHPDSIYKIHTLYLEAGADVISTNTFGANPFKLCDTKYTLSQTVEKAVSIARQAVSDYYAKTGKKAFIALSVGSMGKLLKPLGQLDFEDAVSAYASIVTSGEKAGVDLILFETMSDPYEMKAALLAAKENTNLPVILTMILDSKGKLISGGSPANACFMLEGMGIDGIGINCGEGPEQLVAIVPELVKYSSVPILCNPNAGIPVSKGGKAVYNVDKFAFAKACVKLVEAGVSAVGGCCGTNNEYIKEIANEIKGKEIKPVSKKNFTAVASRSRISFFGSDPLIIGERINPTGKPLFKEALKNGDIEYILREGLAQQEKGAHILDVNVGLPGIDEVSMLTKAVEALQAVTELPLQLDTSNYEALEKALRIYNGKPLINSVNGSEESMAAIFPLMKKYGAAAVCLAMDENGIPEEPEGRLKIIEKIISKAKEYGIDKKDLIADGIVTSAASTKNAAEITIKTITQIKEKLGLHTVLGISNISFGLPKRDNINAAFFGMALEAGLSAGIVNPLSESMMSAYYSSRALEGYKAQYAEYVDKYIAEPPKEKVYSELTLYDSIISGLAESASKATKKLLDSTEPLVIISEHLVPALDEVGKEFEKGKMFLPQLLMAAEAAKAAFEEIKKSYKGEKQSSGHKIIIATVKGDIHDIGKNIVKTLLENYGFDVIDLGKNVPPEVVLEAVLTHRAKLAGLSALMTTTVVNMAETVRLIKEKAPFCKVMVGGAVLTQDYADSIGADFYGKDAVSAVKYARLIFGV
ncbi:MAG: homocysteine S-methyltransferase family protein [Eubacteriales bacterium]|jgi:5-methyltetrahydrofolate--homocysteine methyltransferase